MRSCQESLSRRAVRPYGVVLEGFRRKQPDNHKPCAASAIPIRLPPPLILSIDSPPTPGAVSTRCLFLSRVPQSKQAKRSSPPNPLPAALQSSSQTQMDDRTAQSINTRGNTVCEGPAGCNAGGCRGVGCVLLQNGPNRVLAERDGKAAISRRWDDGGASVSGRRICRSSRQFRLQRIDPVC